MSAVVLLDAGPLGLLAHTRSSATVNTGRAWLASLTAAARRVVVPEITDYEVRRELLRSKRGRAIAHLDALAGQLEYVPLTTAAMRRATELWAHARQAGQATAGDNTIDADMILVAQALTLGVSDVVIATTNIGHFARFVPAELWQKIPP